MEFTLTSETFKLMWEIFFFLRQGFYHIVPVGLKLKYLIASASQDLGSKVHAIMPSKRTHYFNECVSVVVGKRMASIADIFEPKTLSHQGVELSETNIRNVALFKWEWPCWRKCHYG